MQEKKEIAASMRSSLPYTNDYELLQGIASGNADSFRVLFSRYRNKVYAFSLKITRSVYQSEEITQEVFLKLWLYREQMAEVENAEAWIITITKHLCFNQLKKTANEKCIVELQREIQEGMLVSIEQRIDDRDLLVKVRQATAQLTAQEQLVYRMNKEQGLRNEEIASALHISENTVKVHLANALRKIRQLIDRYSAAGIFVLFLLKKIF